MKKYLLIIILGLILANTANAQFSILRPVQGGTGIGSAGVGDVGNCFVVTDDSPFTIGLSSCGGGGVAGAISTTTPLVNGQVVFSTGVASIGNDSAFTWNSTADRLTFTYASTTGWTSSYASSTNGLFGSLSIGSLTGLLKGSSGAVSTAVAGTDYQAPISLTTTGTSGAATFIANVLNIPQYTDTNTTYTAGDGLTLTGTDIDCDTASGSTFGCLSSTDWTTFNNKGSGTVTAVSVASANGFAGSSSGGATPALTLTTSISGMLKGNGTAISAGANGTDYTLITAKTCTAGDFVSSVTAAGVFTCTTPAGTTYTATYPITLIGSAFGLAFGTTTSNTWAGTQTFTNQITGSISGSAGSVANALTNDATLNGSSFNGSSAISDWGLNLANPNTWTGLQTFAHSSTTGQASFVHASTTNFTFGGVTGNDWTDFCVSITGSAGLCDGDDATGAGGGITALGALGQTQTGATQLFASSTTGTDFTITSSANTHTFNLPTASASNRGLLSTTDWSTFNGKADTSSAMTGTFDGIDFTGGALAQNALWVGGAGSAPSELALGTGGYILGVSAGTPAWIATTSIPLGGDVTGTLSATVVGDNSHAHDSTTISGIDISADTNLTGGVGLTLTGDDMACDTASGSVFGCLTSTDWNTFNNKQATIGVTFPITLSGATIGFGGLSTSSAPTVGQLPYWTGVNTFGSVATGTISVPTGLTVTANRSTIGGATAIGLDTGYVIPLQTTLDAKLTALGSGYATTTQSTITFSTSTTAFNGLTFGQTVVPTAGALTIKPTITGTLDNTGLTNSTISGVGLGSALAALTATDSTLTFSGSYTGATARTVGLNLGQANTWTVNQTFNYSSSTVYSSFVTASTTNLRVGLADGCLNITSGLVGSTGSACGSASGLSSYDAWTHPATGYSATTSALTISSTATSTFAGRLSVGTTSTATLASATFTIKGLMSAVMQVFTSAGTKIMDITDSVVTLLGTWDFSGATVKQHTYATFAYSTSTAWTATTTIALGVAFNAEYWDKVKCYTDVGTVNISVYDGTNRMNMFNASTTIGTVTFSTNNTFTASEKRYIDIGTPASSPTKISCTTDVITNY